MKDKTIITLVLLAFITTIILAFIISDYLVTRQVNNFQEEQLLLLEEMQNETRQHYVSQKKSFSEQLENLTIEMPKTESNNVNITQEELNTLLLDVMNSFMYQNELYYDGWNKEMDLILQELADKKYVRKTVYITQAVVS